MKQLALITGASRGIGACLTLALAERGLDIIAIARQKAPLEELKSHYPKQINIISGDLSNATGRAMVVNELSQFSNINYLVHNAGTIAPIGPMVNASEEAIYSILELNLITPLLLTTHLIPQLSKKCRILNMASVAGKQAVSGVGAYCITKAGINMLTGIQRQELQAKEIFATQVIPGEVDTDMQKALREAPISKFPLATEFQQAKEAKSLIPSKLCASFLSWLLLDTSDEVYSSQDWSIYDKSHHHLWLKGLLPLPLNSAKTDN